MSPPGNEPHFQQVGRYVLKEKLGEGPNGEVFRAVIADDEMNGGQAFAYKRFHRTSIGSATACSDLERAARVYGVVEHPNIAKLCEYEFSEPQYQRQSFTVTEWVDGCNLGQVIRQQQISQGSAAHVVIALGRVLGHAHGHGLMHLGLCPSNILCTKLGQLKVTDFGILPSRLSAVPGEDVGLRERLNYLAPEQLQGQRTSPATDVFQLGAIAYELLTGRTPYPEASGTELVRKILSAPIPSTNLPNGLHNVIKRALAKVPFERFSHAGAMAEAMEDALNGSPLAGRMSDIGHVVGNVQRMLRAPTQIGEDMSSKLKKLGEQHRADTVPGEGVIQEILLGPAGSGPVTSPGQFIGGEEYSQEYGEALDFSEEETVVRDTQDPAVMDALALLEDESQPKRENGDFLQLSDDVDDLLPTPTAMEHRSTIAASVPPIPTGPTAGSDTGAGQRSNSKRLETIGNSPSEAPPAVGPNAVPEGQFLPQPAAVPQANRSVEAFKGIPTHVWLAGGAGLLFTAAIIGLLVGDEPKAIHSAVQMTGTDAAAAVEPVIGDDTAADDGGIPITLDDAGVVPITTETELLGEDDEQEVTSDGLLHISSRPAGAKVYLDGTLVGKTPLELEGSADSHRLALILSGYDFFAGDIGGQDKVEQVLAEVTTIEGPAGLKIRCRQKNRYFVIVDGIPTGQLCPTERIGVSLGKHLVETYDPVTDSRRAFDVEVVDTRHSLRVRVD